jgi:serine/threonine protein kinase
MHGVADYEFVRPLAAGEHGQCFLARRPPRLPVAVDFVVVKVLHGASTADTFRIASRDLRTAAAIRSPYLVTLYDVGQQDGRFFYAMEYLPDGSLAERAQAGHLPDFLTVLRMVRDAARGAAALHAAGLVHGAIKPANVLVTSYGGKLSDINLAHILAPGNVLTGSGLVAAVEYADPDLLRGEPSGPHHDVWSIGAMLHRLASGRGLHGELPSAEGLAALRHLVATMPQISPGLPARAGGILAGCLAPPSHRPPAVAVADQLAAALADEFAAVTGQPQE